MKKETKAPRNIKKLASLSVDETPEEEQLENEKPPKNTADIESGRLGGLKGGKAKAGKLSEKQRRMIAIKAAHARWKKK